ncbi:hypothetical protein BH23PLA1_BH23PLA1_16610 [soil metagenome]
MNYRRLKPEEIIETQIQLHQRICKRFPDSGLSQVSAELLSVAQEAMVRAVAIRRRNIPLRLAVVALGLGVLLLAVVVGVNLRVQIDGLRDVTNLVPFVESACATFVFVGATAIFLMTLESRMKRRRALAAIHELRALAHIVDMHQLSKDPEGLAHRGPVIARPNEKTTRTFFDLNRYLNYCIELLAIISKVAALYVQDFNDAVAVSAVDQVEDLCSVLARKIWQKVMILDRLMGGEGQYLDPNVSRGR